MRTATILLFLALGAPAATGQDYVGEHLPKRAKPPLAGQLPAGLAPYGVRAGGTPDPVFDRLVDDAITTLLALDPVHATELGFHQFDAMLPGADSAGVAALEERASRVDPGKLDSVRRDDYGRLRAAITAAAHPPGNDPVDCLDLAMRAIRSLLASDFAPLEDRGWNVVARTNGIGPMLRAARANLQGTRIARADALLAIARAKELVAYLSNTLPVGMAGVKDKVLREEFDHHLAQAAGAAADYHDWLVTEVLPKAAGEPMDRTPKTDSLAELVRR